MASTKLIRKAQKNRSRANARKTKIKRLLTQPVIKKVDVEELKAQFGGAKAKKAAPKKAKADAPKAEAEVKETVAVEAKEETPKAKAPKKEEKAAPAKESKKEAEAEKEEKEA